MTAALDTPTSEPASMPESQLAPPAVAEDAPRTPIGTSVLDTAESLPAAASGSGETTGGGGAPPSEAAGLSPLLVGVLQSCAGAVVMAPGSCCCIYTLGISPLLFAPMAGLVMAWLGDALGTKRGAIMWPTLALVAANYAGWLVVSGVGGAIAALFMVTMASGGTLRSGYQPPWMVPVGAAVLGVGTLIGALGGAVVGAVAYDLNAQDRRPGDDGHGLPGVLEPEHRAPLPASGAVDHAAHSE